MLRLLPLLLLLFTLLVDTTMAEECHRVRYVVDGDTIVLVNGTTIRYLGINTPEIPHYGLPGEVLGDAAREANRSLTEGKQVYLEYNQERKDRYGRHLAFVYDCRTKQMINLKLLQMGYGYLLSNGLEGPRIRDMLDAQRSAMQSRKGIWIPLTGKQEPADIFGNTRSRKFHLLRCPSGKRTSRSNRKTFLSVYSAFNRGYAPCKVCFTDLLKHP